jgi:NADPH:quinone reductase-like Zn-dependent oxidoreductase
MKAVVLHEYGGPEKLTYEDWDDPHAGDQQMVIRVTAAGINPIDWKIRSGMMKSYMPLELPTILGYDYSGVVHSVGGGVQGYAKGDEVFGRASKAYAEYLLADPKGIAKLPEGLDLIEAAALPVVLNTGEQLINQVGKVRAGQTVIITGALGSVGRTAVWVAKKIGAHVIAGVRGSQKKAAEELGADSVLALDSSEEIAALGSVDVVADTIGGAVGSALLAKVAAGGTYASVVGPIRMQSACVRWRKTSPIRSSKFLSIANYHWQKPRRRTPKRKRVAAVRCFCWRNATPRQRAVVRVFYCFEPPVWGLFLASVTPEWHIEPHATASSVPGIRIALQFR